MKAAAPALALLLALAVPAVAGTCQEDLAKVDAAIAAPDLAPDVKTQAQDMAAQSKQLCDAGNEEEGVDILAEAIALLGIE